MNIKKRPNHKLYIQALRRMSPEQRLLKAFEYPNFPGISFFMDCARDFLIYRMVK